jgi:hypothetical protein
MRVRVVSSELGLDLVEAKHMQARVHVRYAPSVVVLCGARSVYCVDGVADEIKPGLCVVRDGGQALVKICEHGEAGK